jgi:hypothetical protein
MHLTLGAPRMNVIIVAHVKMFTELVKMLTGLVNMFAELVKIYTGLVKCLQDL